MRSDRSYRGKTLPVFVDSSGDFWVHDPDSDTYYKVIGDLPWAPDSSGDGGGGTGSDPDDNSDDGVSEVPDNPLPAADDPVIVIRQLVGELPIADQVAILNEMDAPGHEYLEHYSIPAPAETPEFDLGGAEFSFDESADLAHASFVIPADNATDVVDPSTTPFEVEWSSVTNADGSVTVTYDGTINNVLGVMQYQGIAHMSFSDPTVGQVDMRIDTENSIATFDVNGQPAPGAYNFKFIYDPTPPSP